MEINVKEMSDKLGLTFLAGSTVADKPVTGMYVGDLLSWVMSHAEEDAAWVTVQGHVNVVAVAALVGLSCVILAEGAEADGETLAKADDQGIPLLRTSLTAFETAARFAALS